MPPTRTYATLATRALLLSGLTLAAGALCSARAQYVGSVNTSQNTAPTLRATAVLEYLGDLAKPNASRLVPIAVWDGEHYQPGGLYLAQPVPLTVETGTQYVLEQAGIPKGYFNVKDASDIEGSWIAVGTYQKPSPPQFAKLRVSKHPPVIVDDQKPHFAHVPAGDTKAGATTTAQNNAPAIDPERPTLQRRSSGDNAQGNSAPSNSAPVDPNRPILREPKDMSASANANTAPETTTMAVDPNRPHLSYGKPAAEEALDKPTLQISRLAGNPVGLEQMVAVSDAVTRPQQSYVYDWTDPQDKAKKQAELETIAQQLLASSAPKPEQPAHARRRRTARGTPKPAPPALTDEQFKAYELAYGAGPTLIFSATENQGDNPRYITLIAQPDFNGTPVVLYKHITSKRDLSVIPRMKLIDAVDTDADNRAELIFELENKTGRQYAIYRVADGTAEQVFKTDARLQAP